MPLHLTKVAFGATSLDHLVDRLRERGDAGPVFLTTRYLPKRHEEVAAGGSLYWIIKHTLVARSAILGFGEAEGGRVSIHIDPQLVVTAGRPKRAHQGWRYLEPGDAPADLAAGAEGGDALPAALIGKLAALGLL